MKYDFYRHGLFGRFWGCFPATIVGRLLYLCLWFSCVFMSEHEASYLDFLAGLLSRLAGASPLLHFKPATF